MVEAVLKCAELEEAMSDLLLGVAARSKGAQIQKILKKNAEEEKEHARALRSLAEKSPPEKLPAAVARQAADWTRQAREMTGKLAESDAPLMPADALQVALAFEEWCAGVYAEMRGSVRDPVLVVALRRIGEEELEHCKVLQWASTDFT